MEHGDLDRPQGQIVAKHEQKTLARDIVRRWLREPTGAVLEEFGASAIKASADATIHSAALAAGRSGQAIVADVERIVSAWEAPAPSRFRWLANRRSPSAVASCEAIGALAARLEQERDESTRRTILLNSSRDRLLQVADRLEQSLATIACMRPMIDAAAREIRIDQPELAATVQARGAAILMEREHALLTQRAIHHQAVMTLDLMAANEKVLDATIVQARTASLSALKVAIAARQVVNDQMQIDPGLAAARARNTLIAALSEARKSMEELAPRDNRTSPLDL